MRSISKPVCYTKYLVLGFLNFLLTGKASAVRFPDFANSRTLLLANIRTEDESSCGLLNQNEPGDNGNGHMRKQQYDVVLTEEMI